MSEPRAVKLSFDTSTMKVHMDDGRVLDVALGRFPRLLRATPEQRRKVLITVAGLHWDELDEDISLSHLLMGYGDRHAGQAVK